MASKSSSGMRCPIDDMLDAVHTRLQRGFDLTRVPGMHDNRKLVGVCLEDNRMDDLRSRSSRLEHDRDAVNADFLERVHLLFRLVG